jgi:hypothetical protein
MDGVVFNAAGYAIPAEEIALQRACRARKIGLYFCKASRQAGKPHIRLTHRGIGLGEFRSCRDALEWLMAGCQP